MLVKTMVLKTMVVMHLRFSANIPSDGTQVLGCEHASTLKCTCHLVSYVSELWDSESTDRRCSAILTFNWLLSLVVYFWPYHYTLALYTADPRKDLSIVCKRGPVYCRSWESRRRLTNGVACHRSVSSSLCIISLMASARPSRKMRIFEAARV